MLEKKIAEGATGVLILTKQKGSGAPHVQRTTPWEFNERRRGARKVKVLRVPGRCLLRRGGKQVKHLLGSKGQAPNPMTPGGKEDGSDDAASNETAAAEGSPAKSAASPKGPPSGLGAPGKTGQGGAPDGRKPLMPQTLQRSREKCLMGMQQTWITRKGNEHGSGLLEGPGAQS
ncbi:MAG: hypothetical protein U0894_03415 [Pirellulales bacterium]